MMVIGGVAHHSGKADMSDATKLPPSLAHPWSNGRAAGGKGDEGDVGEQWEAEAEDE